MDEKELKELRKKLHKTLTGPALPVEAVIDAADILVREMQSGVYSDLLDQYDLTDYPERLSLTAKQLGRRTLQKRLEEELPCAPAYRSWQHGRIPVLYGAGRSDHRQYQYR